MNIYKHLTEEQIKISSSNNGKARRWFKRHGYMPNSKLTYDLHHKDVTLRTNNLDRYIEWRIDDLEVLEHSEHTKLHAKLKSLPFEIKSERARKMWNNPESYVNSKEYREAQSKLVHNNHIKKDSPYNEDWKRKISKSCENYWTEDKKLWQSNNLKKKWADSNCIYRTKEVSKRKADSHKKHVIITDGKQELTFESEYECGIFLGYDTKEKATNNVGRMIKTKGIVTKVHSPYYNWVIKRKED